MPALTGFREGHPEVSWLTLPCRQVDVQVCDTGVGLARLGGFARRVGEVSLEL